MPYTYILECYDGSFYTGSTWDLERRLEEHNSGVGANYTSKRLPVKLVYFEEFDRIDDAYYREKQIQKWTHKKKMALIERNYKELHELAECQNESHYLLSSAWFGLVRLRSPSESNVVHSLSEICSLHDSFQIRSQVKICSLSVAEGNGWRKANE